jgi:hypothetical protein
MSEPMVDDLSANDDGIAATYRRVPVGERHSTDGSSYDCSIGRWLRKIDASDQEIVDTWAYPTATGRQRVHHVGELGHVLCRGYEAESSPLPSPPDRIDGCGHR